jgi:hypothetical protein
VQAVDARDEKEVIEQIHPADSMNVFVIGERYEWCKIEVPKAMIARIQDRETLEWVATELRIRFIDCPT